VSFLLEGNYALPRKLDLYARAMQLSLENAEHWVEDAKLLAGNFSFGHATALLRFACEETAKAHVCWLTSEKIIPTENKVILDVFRYHGAKNSIILSTLLIMAFLGDNHLKQKIDKESLELSEEKIVESYEMFEEALVSTDKMRQKAMYVDVNLEDNNVETPLTIEEKEAKAILRVAETFLKIVRYHVEKSSEMDKAELRKVYSSIPKEGWKTGQISIAWILTK